MTAPDQKTDPKSSALNRPFAPLQTLTRLAEAISSTLEIETILQTLLRESIQLTGAEQGSILSFTEEEERPVQTLYKTVESASGAELSGLSDLVGGWVLQNRTLLLSEAFDKDPRFEKAKSWFPEIVSVLAVPMMVRDMITGIIILTRPTAFSKEDSELMSIIAAQCAQFLENAKRYQRVLEENIHLRREVQQRFDFEGVIGKSPSMQHVFELLQRVIPGEARILIEGESGTGKELIARTIHYNGPRRDRNFVAVDCGALPENLLESELFGHVKGAFTGAIRDKKGLFELANYGTLFLDEITNTTPLFQSKLLRAIQEGEIKPVGAANARKVDVRIIAATSGNLQQRLENGEFREDLYYRLNVIAVKLPPLRERREDIRMLAEHFLKTFAEKSKKGCHGFTGDALQKLESYSWPGNIRELENVIERAVALTLPDESQIALDLLPQHICEHAPSYSLTSSSGPLNESLALVERKLISEALAKHNDNRTEAAKALGITRQTLLAKIKKHRL